MDQNKTIIGTVMMPNQANPNGNVFGGEIMKMMDSAAYACGYKYAHMNVVTARVDELEFHKPIFIGDLVNCTAEVVFVGHSSMEIFVNVEVEDIEHGDKPEQALTAYFTMVAMDRNGRPKAVAPLKVTTPEQRAAFEEGKERYEAHKARKRKQREAAFVAAKKAEQAAQSAKK